MIQKKIYDKYMTTKKSHDDNDDVEHDDDDDDKNKDGDDNKDDYEILFYNKISCLEKKESLASVLKKKFNKMKQPRSQSADRAGNYLKPPSDKSVTLQVSSATKNISGLICAVSLT